MVGPRLGLGKSLVSEHQYDFNHRLNEHLIEMAGFI